MKAFIITAIFILNTVMVSAQTDPKQSILDLKEGTLIVNLIVPTKKIAALRENGNKPASLELEKTIAQENEAIKLAFVNNYTFSKVLFIYSYDMGALADGNPSVLFDELGNKQSQTPESYLFVEFNETTNRNIDGFVVKDRNRDDMLKPFPNFISHYKPLRLGKRTFKTMVEMLNNEFDSFHATASKRK